MTRFDLQSRLLPAPKKGGFRMEGYWVWDGSTIRGEDGRYHLFASRWPKKSRMHPGWLFYSEIVRASSDTIEGPYEFEEVVLGPGDKSYFDGRMTHNPSIRKVGDTYLLFYIGVTYAVDPPDEPDWMGDESTSHANPWVREIWTRKRIGLATSRSVFGPWKRSDEPILKPRIGKWDRGTTSNPAPWVMPDGSIYLAYKSSYPTRGTQLAPFNIGIARAPSWQDPFERVTDEPVVPHPHPDSFVEDPFLWHADRSFHMIMKDQSGHITGDEGSGIYMASEDGKHWEMGDPPLAYTRKLTWDTGESEEVSNFERPQLLFNESGEMTHMIGATARGQGLNKATETCVTIVPLKSS